MGDRILYWVGVACLTVAAGLVFIPAGLAVLAVGLIAASLFL